MLLSLSWSNWSTVNIYYNQISPESHTLCFFATRKNSALSFINLGISYLVLFSLFSLFCDDDYAGVGGIPDHHCKLPNGTDVNVTIPKEKDGSLSNCKIYNDTSDNTSAIDCPYGYHYYGDVGSTIVSEVISTLLSNLLIKFHSFKQMHQDCCSLTSARERNQSLKASK